MITKFYQINDDIVNSRYFFLFYGNNEGNKMEILNNIFKKQFTDNVIRYDEVEIINNPELLFNNINNRSFFEKKKIILIERTTDKFFNIIKDIYNESYDDIKIILFSNQLEKKSKLRNFFEKEKKLICVPFYADDSKTLSTIIYNFFKKKKISITQEIVNLLVERSNGDRKNLNNELEKIDLFTLNKKKVSLEEVFKISNLSENFSVSELIDNCLSKNKKKTINIFNENNYSSEDCILILRVLLIKTKRLLKLKKEAEKNKNTDEIINSFKPPIFWKEKEIVKKQITYWSLKETEKLIFEIGNIEMLIKQNSSIALNIISDFIIDKCNTSTNN